MAKAKKRRYREADTFFDSLLKDKEVRVLFEQERARSQLAMAVRLARKRAKLTQAQLAKKARTTQSVIARLESGTNSRMPSLPLLGRIAAACDGELEVGFKFSKVG